MGKRNTRRDDIQVTLERGQATTILAGSVVGLGLVFLLGVVVGSRLAPTPAMAAPLETVAAADPAPEPVEAKAQPELTFHDALTSTKVTPPALPEPAAKPVAAKPAAAKPASRTEPAAPAQVAASPAKPAAQPAPAKPAAEPAPEAPSGPAVYTVQVASSREEKDTQRLADRLDAAGYDARVVPADIPGKGRWYRVRVGRYETRNDAAMKQAEIKVALNMAGLVVAE